MSETLGFIGLGSMGEPMARNLLAAGYALRVYNRTAGKAEQLGDRGVQVVASAAETAEPGGIVITMVANDAALEAVTIGSDGILERLAPGGIHLSMSTIAPATAEKLAQAHEAHGSHYVAAPVFGRPDAAAARKLWICVSGQQEAKERVRPILDALGQGTFDMGDASSAASVVKLVGNFLIASAIEAMSEAFTLAEKHGIDRSAVKEVFTSTLFASPIYQNYGKIIAERRQIPPGFKASLGLKDLTLVQQAAAASQTPMPLASLLHDRLMGLTANGRGEEDWTLALAMSIAEDAGLPGLKSE